MKSGWSVPARQNSSIRGWPIRDSSESRSTRWPLRRRTTGHRSLRRRVGANARHRGRVIPLRRVVPDYHALPVVPGEAHFAVHEVPRLEREYANTFLRDDETFPRRQCPAQEHRAVAERARVVANHTLEEFRDVAVLD